MISVIVPVYKVEPYLERCIESILCQSYKDLEIILVDDGSPDKCGKICDEYAIKDRRVKVIHKKNGGLSSARNAGLEIATGDYVSFIDSDDWIDQGMYQTMIDVASGTSADIIESGYRFYRPWKTENKILETQDTGEVKVYNNIEALNTFYFGPQMFHGLTVMVWNKIYKRQLLNELQFAEGYINEDLEFTPRAFYYANKIAKIEKTFYNYNIHLGTSSTSGMKLNLLKIDSAILMRQRVMMFFERNQVDKVSRFTAESFYSSLLNGYYNCWSMRKEGEEYTNRRHEIMQMIREKKSEILEYNPGRKTKLFFASPWLYCNFVWAYRKSKEIKYKATVFLTGKN